MSTLVPMFPLNTVIFPGVTTPLHIFEPRYRRLVQHLKAVEDPTERVFGVTAIREGYEVGDHGRSSLHTTGTLVQLTEVEEYDDGRYDIEIVGRSRLLLLEMLPEEEFPAGRVQLLGESDDPFAEAEAERTVAVFERYRQRLGEIRGGPVLAGELPRDPTFLSWTLAGTCLLTLAERQRLLQAEPASERLGLIRMALRQEMRAMAAIASLPATQVARTRWCPN